MQVKTFGDLFQWVPVASGMDPRRTDDDVLIIAAQFSTIPSVKYGMMGKI